MNGCGARGKNEKGEEVVCTLGVGHGGVHANREQEERGEASTIGREVRKDYPTIVFRTRYTWRDGETARTYRPAR